MKNIYNLIIILSFFGLWLASMLSDNYQTVLGFILIFSLGILHGSNDVLLIQTIDKEKQRYSSLKILGSYLFMVGCAILMFYFIPTIALLFFIIFSAHHFGEQHWEGHKEINRGRGKDVYYLSYGLFVLSLLFFLNKGEVAEIIFGITGFDYGEQWMNYTFFITGTVLCIWMFIKALMQKDIVLLLLREFFYLLIFAIIFEVSSLIWGFTIYFILWHSIPSLVQQVGFIYGTFNKKTSMLYLKKALVYWLISLAGIAGVYYIFREDQLFYVVFFSFLAAVTFPHVLVINKMFHREK